MPFIFLASLFSQLVHKPDSLFSSSNLHVLHNILKSFYITTLIINPNIHLLEINILSNTVQGHLITPHSM